MHINFTKVAVTVGGIVVAYAIGSLVESGLRHAVKR